MSSNSTSNDAMHANNELSLDESSELLAEVRRASQEAAQTELYEFACVVSQVVDLQRREGATFASDESSAKFIATSLDEIRRVFASSLPTSGKMESLRIGAVKQWGNKLTPLDEMDQSDASVDDVDLWGASDDDEPVSDSDVVAPSAEEVSAMLSRLGKVSAPETSPADAESSAPAKPPASAQLPVAKSRSAPMTRPAPMPPKVTNAPPPVSLDSLDPELREAFLDDATSCVGSIEDSLLRLESDPQHADALNQILRELHTLKGASASVGLSDMAKQLHGIEDSLRDDQVAGRCPEINSLLKSVDSIRSQIAGDDEISIDEHLVVDNFAPAPVSAAPPPASAAPTHSTPPTVAPRPAPTAAAAPVASPAPAAVPARTRKPPSASFNDGPADDESVRVQSSQLNRLMDMLAELVMLRNRRETELSELHEAYHDLIGSVSKMRILGHEGYQQTTSSSSLQLSEVANDVLEVAQNVRDCARPVAEGNVAVSQFIRQFRQELVQLRRTPVSGLFRRLQRVVRDTAQAETKQVSLELLGEDAGIERSLQQRLYEPLLHIVRNSVCHGIETPDERTKSGKMPVGTITLEAKSGPDMFMIEIRDDGRGLDYDAIRRRAVESGLVAANQPVSHEELSQLIFQPGFSTRQTADQMAGRGVGMDVVATTLQRMRGWYEVKSEPLKGTRIRLTFPLPSVIQHVMVFRSGSQLFALPMQSVQSAGEVEKDSVCLSFSDLTGDRQANAADACQRIVLACEAPISREDGVSSAFVTLLVDEIVGPEEVVVRPLPSLLKQHPFCSGATLSGMGQTVLFLDARRLVESHIRLLHRPKPTNGGDPSGQAASDARPSRPRVLVVDDSISARKRVVRSLRRYPIDVVEAADGKQALELLKTQQFDAVFSDMEMPHVSGMELLAEINSDNRTDAPPVVIISSRCEDEFTERAKQLGAIRYLPKPLTDNALDGALRGIESLRRLSSNQSATSQPSMEIQ